MAKLPVAICMISGAEERRIGCALASVAPWAGELIIVLNEDAHDSTESIAARFGARVFREPWKGFIAQKNSAADKAHAPWLLNVDADEVVSPALAAEIANVVSNPIAPSHAAYEFPRCTFYCGRWIRHGDWYPDRVRRLWKRGAARWAGQEPHARLESSGAVGQLHSDLLHYSNENIAAQLAKIAPYHAPFVEGRRAARNSTGALEWLVRPWWKFMRGYFFRAGFLDGWQGFYIAALGSFSTLTRLAMIREAQAKSCQPSP